MKILLLIKIYFNVFYTWLNPKRKKSRDEEFERDIYSHLGKTLSNEEIEKLNKKYKMRIRWNEWGIKCFTNTFFEYQFEIADPTFDHIIVRNNVSLLALNLKWSDTINDVKEKFGNPDITDFKENSIYYFSKKVCVKFRNIEDTERSFKELLFIEEIKNMKGFIELKNKEYNRKKDSVPNKPDLPMNFGYKWFWYAVKSTDLSGISKLLKLKRLSECNWESGIDRAIEKGDIFLTPPIDGWTLIVGHLPNDADQAEESKELLNKLSKEYGESQFFQTYRVVEYHCWIKSINGEVTRAYSYLGERGETLLFEGEPTEFEKRYKLINTHTNPITDENNADNDGMIIPDEEFLMTVANNWSVDPSKLSDRKDLDLGLGLIGKMK